jgi:hypothetical protein
MGAVIPLKACKGKDVAKPYEPTVREAETLANFDLVGVAELIMHDDCQVIGGGRRDLHIRVENLDTEFLAFRQFREHGAEIL